jgi:large subunit ribosomal protein L24
MAGFRVRRDDTVQVLTGRDRGKRGKITELLVKAGRARVQGVNLVKRHHKAGAQGARQAGIVEKEAPVHLSNLALVCTKCDKATRVGHRFLQDGSKVRACKKCGEQI